MQYIVIQCQPKDAQKKLNALAADGWKVVFQSESTREISSCFGLSKNIDSIINYTLIKENGSSPYPTATYENEDSFLDFVTNQNDDVNTANDNECPCCFATISQDDVECPNCGYKLK